ncbi:MAG: HlyD family efflux transporter periplasmic adaptor subunit, partial [Planctomycetota bacterium]
EVRAKREASVGFETGGRIVTLAVDEGAAVAAGQTLGRVDVATLEARRARTEAELAEAKARLAELVAGPRAQTVAVAAANLRQLDADLALAKARLGRRRTLLERNAITREEYDEELFAAEAVAARRDAAAETLAELEEGTRVEQLDAQKARVAALQAAVAEIAEQVDNATLRAPFDAVVVARERDEGAVVAAGETVFRLVDAAAPEAWVGVPAATAALLSRGDVVRVRVGGAERPGFVRDVLAELSPTTRTRGVIVTLATGAEDAASLPVSGEVARLLVETEASLPEGGVRVPRGALVRGTRGLWACFVVVPDGGGGPTGEIARRDVELLEIDGGDAIVRGTLSAGERVVAEGTHRVVPGQQVRVTGGDAVRTAAEVL